MKIKFATTHWILLGIIILASFLRFWKLVDAPPSLTPDEASLGYNAYTILHTGKDFWGERLPIIFKSFGDYTPGLYVYLTVPFVAIMGLNEWSVRLPNALLGILIVGLVYQLTRMLFRHPEFHLQDCQTTDVSGSDSNTGAEKRRMLKQVQHDVLLDYLPLAVAFLAAINPWLIMFSRGAWLPNVCLFLTLLGIYFLFIALTKHKYLFLSSLFFALSILSYQGAKLSVAIAMVLLGILFYKDFLHIDKKIIGGSFLLGFFIVLPIVLSVVMGNASRLSVVSVFSYPRSQEEVSHVLLQGDETKNSFSTILFHSEKLQFARVILGKWFNHFSGRFLFFEGDWENPRFSSPYQGMLLLIDLILLPLGVYVLSQIKGKGKWLVLLWLILSPLPAILSRDQVHAARALNMAIPLTLISGFGLWWIVQKIGLIRYSLMRYLSAIMFISFFALSYVYYLDSYYVHLPKHNAKHWDYGYKQVVLDLSADEYLKEERKIIVQQSFEQPFIYFLFYEPLMRNNYLEYQESEVGDVGQVVKMGNITFQGLSYPFQFPTGTIVVADEVAAPINLITNDLIIRREIKRPDGTVAFRILEAK